MIKKIKIKIKSLLLKIISSEKNMLLASLCVGIIVSLAYCGYSAYAYSKDVNTNLREAVVRFHVIANSDSEIDQSLKLKVRDAVLTRYSDELSKLHDKSEAEKFFQDNMEQIQKLAQQEVIHNGFEYEVNVSLEETFFPTKNYGDFSLPAGNYEALRIVIGNGSGKNWWCVMFPPLCYVDVTHSNISSEMKDQLKTVLDEDEYNIVMSSENTDMQYKIKFKIVEWLQSLAKDKKI